jgi:hypothetical protein
MKNIGFVENFYYTPKGHSYVIQDMLKSCNDAGLTTHMYRISNNPEHNPRIEEFESPATEKIHHGLEIPEEEFRKWVKENNIDYCIFMEYNQWFPITYDKLRVCNEMGVRAIGWLVYERLDWKNIEHYKQYYKIISPTKFQTKLFRTHGVFNVVYVPWGVDIAFIDSITAPPRENPKKYGFFIARGVVGLIIGKTLKKLLRPTIKYATKTQNS